MAGTRWASFEANPQAQRLVFKSSLVLSDKAAKDNFTAEPHVLRRLLGRIEPICNHGEGFDEALLQVWWSNNCPFGDGTAMPTDSRSLCVVIEPMLNCGRERNRLGLLLRTGTWWALF
ncbi:hypothetical protein ACFQHW_03800 [Lapidilactobacillus achengensis]|uniref:Uncharacterized protein n=1 Tax=Lapidilactobacillus achengensis TaxID=2486000 RepID=A0ABW1UL90_9LACO|nr:hypothetical protein [Lapidilactobacillus achengensis]